MLYRIHDKERLGLGACALRRNAECTRTAVAAECGHGLKRLRWRHFVSDCQNFLTSCENWAERAAELGWNARTLFGCHRNYPLMHLGSAGLLWAINGGKLVKLDRDWAVIELPTHSSQRTFYRRELAAGKVILPWDRA